MCQEILLVESFADPRSRADRNRNFALDATSATLHFVGWVEPVSGFVGFRFTLPNLRVVNSIVQSETQR